MTKSLLPFALGLAILCSTLSEARAQPALDEHEACTLRSVVAARLSPDGRLVAYETSLARDPRREDGPAGHELRILGVDEDGPGRFYLDGSFSSWRWHPDGRSILFLDRRGDDVATSLYRLPIDGGEARRLFAPVASIRHWDLGGDGDLLVYTCAVPAPPEAERGRGFDQYLFGTRETEVALHVVRLGTGLDQRIELDGAPWSPVVAPDRRKVAFWRSPSSSTDDGYMKKRLWLLDLETGRAGPWVDNPGKVGDLVWSPDSDRVAYVSAVDAHDPKESSLMLAKLGEARARQLSPADLEGHVAAPVWTRAESPDGPVDRIYVLVERGLISEVMFLAPDGGELQHPARIVAVAGADRDPVIWRSLDVAVTAKGPIFAATADSARHPGEVFVQGRRRSFSNPRTLDSGAGRRLGEQEGVRYRARDGLEIEGVLIWPTDYEEGKLYPLICVIHGGPEAHYADGWLTSYSMPGQVAAARGYFVFHPNYRSSTGRGVAFSKAGQGRAAREEFDDIVDGIDHLVDRHLVDRDKVGITGGSYGGYASAWAATYYSDRFAASVMFVGISEQISKVFTTDIPEESYLVHWRKRPFGNWQSFLEASPIYWVERAHTPLLILHGEKDPRVPVAQSIALHRALKMKGDVPVRLVLYPREQHGNRNAAARFDYALRMMRWFDTYLRGPGVMPAEKVDYGIK
ncbi:MAG: S9 family peptidase [Planctomycetes bacterium]|nr:S9 family peptidase [Planctomycetota bacterium]